MINFIKNNDLINHIKEYDVILVGTNIRNTLGNGFQHKIAKSFPFINEINSSLKYDDKNRLGKVLFTEKKENLPLFCICYIFRHRIRPDLNPDALDYDALKSCIRKIDAEYKGKKIASTIMGYSPFEGGGDKDEIISIFEECIKDNDIDLYDYEQIDYRIEENNIYRSIVNDYKEGKIAQEEYYERMKKYTWERSFGFYTPMPENMNYWELKNEIKRLKPSSNTIYSR